MNATELKNVLDLHAMWLNDNTTGERADLRCADLSGADLSWADLRDANIDYSSWGLSCKTKDVKVDRCIAAQLAAHFCVLTCDDHDYQAARSAILEFARTSHRAADLGLLEEVEG